MRMKPFLTGGKISRNAARNAALVNLLATPGLGSLMARRWFAGIGQLALAIIGFVLFIIWFIKVMIEYYEQIGSDAPTNPIHWKMAVIGTVLFVLSWFWSAVTSSNLMREAAANTERSIKNFAAPPALKFGEAQIILALAVVPDWKRDGDVIARTFQFKDFHGAIKFTDAVAGLAEEAWHHPDIDIRWNKVTLALTTHDAGGLTGKDFELAKKFDALSLR
jgi:4a-hydroxytetrahydrobiopterin dehydratase